MKREGKTIYDVTRDIETTAIFKQYNSFRSLVEYKYIYYLIDSGIKKGDTIRFNNDYYIIVNVSATDSESYIQGVMQKCTDILNFGKGMIIPVAITSVNADIPKYLSTEDDTDGDTSFICSKDSDLLKVFNEHVGIMMWGSIYYFANKFYSDGICYVCLKNDYASSEKVKERTYSFSRNEIKTLECGKYAEISGVERYTFSDGEAKRTTYCPEVKVYYKSSDTSICTVDENGVLKGISTGKVTITIWTDSEHKDYLGNIKTNEETFELEII